MATAKRSKPIRTTTDALAWIASAVAEGKLEQPKMTGERDDLRVIYTHACTRCGGDGYYYGPTGGGVCFGCGGRKMVSKRLAPIEFAKRLRTNIRTRERREAARSARREAAKARNQAKGYGAVTGREVYDAKVGARVDRRWATRDARSHTGKIGETFEGLVALVDHRPVRTRFGDREVLTFVTEPGDLLICWASAGEFEIPGERPLVRIRATISKHTVYDAEARTEIKRLEVLGVEGEDEPFSPEELLVVADYLEQDGVQLLADVERAAIACGEAPRWLLFEISESPLVRRGVAMAREQMRRSA